MEKCFFFLINLAKTKYGVNKYKIHIMKDKEKVKKREA